MSKYLGDELRKFDMSLGKVLSGERKGVVKLKDLAYFKRIKSKIESYPILKEIYRVNKTSKHFRIRGKSEPRIKRYSSSSKINLNKEIEKINVSAFDIEHRLIDCMNKTKEVFKMFQKFKISCINSTKSKKLRQMMVKSIFFILLGSLDTYLFYKKKGQGTLDPHVMIHREIKEMHLPKEFQNMDVEGIFCPLTKLECVDIEPEDAYYMRFTDDFGEYIIIIRKNENSKMQE